MKSKYNDAEKLLAIIPLLAISHGVFAEDYGIEEVIVTAQRRVESAQEIPIAITAMTVVQTNHLAIYHDEMWNHPAAVALVHGISWNGPQEIRIRVYVAKVVDRDDVDAPNRLRESFEAFADRCEAREVHVERCLA